VAPSDVRDQRPWLPRVSLCPVARSSRRGASGGGAAGGSLGSSNVRPFSLAGTYAAAVQARPASVTPLSLVRPSVNRGEQSDEDQYKSRGADAPPFSDAGVAAAKRGDPAAWEAAYLAYGKALMGYLMVRLDNRDDAAEALSETFTRAIGKASTLRGDSYAFRAWLFTIARHVSADQHRGRARISIVSAQPDAEDRSQPSNEDVTIVHEDLAELRRGFSRLPHGDQEVLWLRVCTGLSAAEVGEVVGKRPGAVRMQQMRALEALRSQVST
jgi:RNA polymerase sigma-70 factor, ECF subfamily